MGRKTYASIPPKFRPLKDRFNIVITRSVDRPRLVPATSFDPFTPSTTTTTSQPAPSTTKPSILQAPSIESALAYLQQQQQQQSSGIPEIARVFVIGGGELYKAALEMPATKRILLTKIDTEFACDTFFPDLEASGTRWKEKGDEALKEWVGETGLDVETGKQKEGDVGYQFCLYERV